MLIKTHNHIAWLPNSTKVIKLNNINLSLDQITEIKMSAVSQIIWVLNTKEKQENPIFLKKYTVVCLMAKNSRVLKKQWLENWM